MDSGKQDSVVRKRIDLGSVSPGKVLGLMSIPLRGQQKSSLEGAVGSVFGYLECTQVFFSFVSNGIGR